MTTRLLFLLLLGVDAFILIIQTTELSISYRESLFLQGDFSFFQALIKLSLSIFGNNDFALRLPMIILHLFSTIFLFAISEQYLSKRNSLWVVLIFVLLPGIVSSALIVDSAGFIIFGLLLFVYLSTRVTFITLLVYLFALCIVESEFLYLFFALFLYGMYQKKYNFMSAAIVLVIGSIALYGFDAHGYPRGYFLDTIGIYSTIFTPIIFLYIFYVLYRKWLTEEYDMLWFIASSALIVSLLLSFRQRIDVQHFAPYLVLALPLAAQTFNASYRVRLKQFRKNYKLAFIISLGFLMLHSSVVFFNKYLYWVIETPSKHFAYKMHIAKELSQELKKQDIRCVNTNDTIALRLEFYDISKCNDFILTEIEKENKENANVTISYTNKAIAFYSVTKVNKHIEE